MERLTKETRFLRSWWGGEKPGFYLILGEDREVDERNPVSEVLTGFLFKFG
jgi:hypothetical protein